jgi:hypothetical protein
MRCANCPNEVRSPATFLDGKHRDATCAACGTFHQWDEPSAGRGLRVGLIACECPQKREGARAPRFLN